METTVEVQNIKFGDCAQTISNRLERIHGIKKVTVSPDKGVVRIAHKDESALNAALLKLNQIGYPLNPATKTVNKKAVSMLSNNINKLSK